MTPWKQPTIAECDAMFIRPGSFFEIDTEVVHGRKCKVWKHGHRVMRPYFLERMERWADRVFINAPRDEPFDKDERFDTTYGQLHKDTIAIAGWLRSRGVGMGTRVGVVGFNSLEWVSAFIAITLIGAVPTIVNAWLKPEAMVHCLKLSQPALVLADAATADTLAPYGRELASGQVGEILSWATTRHLEHKDLPTVDLFNLPVSVADILSVTSGKGLEGLTPHCPGTIFFTSGTTGMPKGAMLSQSSLLHNVKGGQATAMRTALRAGVPLETAMQMVVADDAPQAKMLHAVPLFHVTGCAHLIIAFQTGRKMFFMRRWSVNDAVKLLVENDIEVIGGVPAITAAILQSPKLPKNFYLKVATYGGAAAPARLAEDLKQRFPGAHIGTAWGMTEAAGMATNFTGDDYFKRPKSSGSPAVINEVCVVDIETGKTLPPNTVGVLKVRGHNVIAEYLNDPEATRKAIDADGWFDTGDAGYIDEEGFVYVSDRIKDIIIRGGENISSEEVENAIYLDNRIAEAAAVPVPCDRLGELVAVAISLKEGATATADDVIEQVASRLRREARPVFVWVSDGLLPMNANGKYIKTEIKVIVRDMYQQHMSRQSKL